MPYEAGTFIRGDVTANRRESHFKKVSKRRDIYKQMPLNKNPLAKVMMSLSSKSIDGRTHEWYMRRFNPMYGEVLDVYTNVHAESTYASGGVAGQMLYITLTEADAKQILKNDQLIIGRLDDDGDPVARILVDVRDVKIIDDTRSYIAVKLRQADTGNDLAALSGLTWRLAGRVDSEMSALPDSVYEEAVYRTNVAQQIMGALSISGTEEALANETNENTWNEMWEQAHDRFMRELEYTVLFGRFNNTDKGDNSEARWAMRGILQALEADAPQNIVNFKTDDLGTDLSGKTWLEAGWPWLKRLMNDLSHYSPNPKTVLCGDLALLAITDLVESLGEVKLEPMYSKAYGMRVNELRGLNTELRFIRYPYFATDPLYRRSALVYEPGLIQWLPIVGRDITEVKPNDTSKKTDNGHTWLDGKKAGLWAQGTIEYHNLDAIAWVDGIGAAENTYGT